MLSNNIYNETYCSLEVSKMLWAKGMKTPSCLLDKWLNINHKPTHTAAINWLLENFNISLEIRTLHKKYFYYCIKDFNTGKQYESLPPHYNPVYNSVERTKVEAIEEGLQRILKELNIGRYENN